MTKIVKNVHISHHCLVDRHILVMLNALAPGEYRNVHQLARAVLLKNLQERIDELGIDLSQTRSAMAG